MQVNLAVQLTGKTPFPVPAIRVAWLSFVAKCSADLGHRWTRMHTDTVLELSGKAPFAPIGNPRIHVHP